MSRSRRSLAKTLEVALDPGHGVRRGLNSWPRIPRANRVAVAEPMREIIAARATPEVAIPERTWQRVLAFVSHLRRRPSGLSNQAGFAATRSSPRSAPGPPDPRERLRPAEIS